MTAKEKLYLIKLSLARMRGSGGAYYLLKLNNIMDIINAT